MRRDWVHFFSFCIFRRIHVRLTWASQVAYECIFFPRWLRKQTHGSGPCLQVRIVLQRFICSMCFLANVLFSNEIYYILRRYYLLRTAITEKHPSNERHHLHWKLIPITQVITVSQIWTKTPKDLNGFDTGHTSSHDHSTQSLWILNAWILNVL